jgi:hypothetical protein
VWLSQTRDAPPASAADTALRNDTGKPCFDLLWCRCFGSLMRHAWAWLRGEDYDTETGSHHLIAVAWNAIAIYTYSMRGVGEDDRPHCMHRSEQPVNEPPCGRVVSAKAPAHR